MSFRKELDLLTTYTQKIDFLSKVVESCVHTNQVLADTVKRLHESHIRICKQTYRTWVMICVDCAHEHPKNLDFEKCEKCGGNAVSYGFPNPEIKFDD